MTFILSFLILCACTALVTMQYRQLGSVLSMIYWFTAWIAQIFALPTAILSLASLLYAVLNHGSTTVIILSIITTIIYAYLHNRNIQAGQHLWQQVHTNNDSTPNLKIPFFTGLAPTLINKKGVTRIKDIPYGEHPERNLLDIYTPDTATAEPMPILIQIHGGMWTMGKKESQGMPLVHHMVRSGWLVVSINYRLAPTHRFPAMITDVLKAIAWIRKNASQYNADANFIAVTGGSAGGHLSALAALACNNPVIKPGFENEDTSVQCALPMYGRYDFADRTGLLEPKRQAILDFMQDKVMPSSLEQDPKLWDLGSPITQISSDAPPFLVSHGSHDSMLAIEEGETFAKALQKTSPQPVVFAKLSGAQHAFDIFQTPLTFALCHSAEHFLTNQLANNNIKNAANNV